MPFRPGDVLTYSPEEHYVYALVDDAGVVFYIGKSVCPQGRLKAHYDRGVLEVRKRLRQLKVPTMRVLAGPLPESVASAKERELIAAAPEGLLNQERQSATWTGKGNQRLPVFQQFCRTASKAGNS